MSDVRWTLVGLVLLLSGCMTSPPASSSSALSGLSGSGVSSSIVGSIRARACFDAARAGQAGREGLAACNRALDREVMTPDMVAATLVNRGIIHMQMRDLAAAVADFDAAIGTRPQTAEAWVNKGIALIRRGEDAEAAALLTHGLELGPENAAVAHYSRAYAYEGLGKLREAYEDYGRAAALAPDWPEPVEQLRRFKVVRVRTAGA